MFVYVACTQGMSASLFCHRMVSFVERQNVNQLSLTMVSNDVETVFRKRDEYGKAYDLIFAYGAVDEIRSFTAYDFGSLFDVVMVGPTESYKTAEKTKLLSDYPTIVTNIPSLLYGRMSVDKGYDMLLSEFITLDLWRGFESTLLATTKSIDKDLEIYVGGGDSNSLYFQKIYEFLENQGIRCCTSKYTLENLYEFKPGANFDVRFIFGPISVLSEREFGQVARRIDAFLVNEDAYFALKHRKRWLRAYKIPYCQYNDDHLKKRIRNGQFPEEEAKVWDFLTRVQLLTEGTSDLIIDNLAKESLGLNSSDEFTGWW